MAYMVWGGGLFSKDGWFGQTFAPVIDFAGGTVVHINAGVAGLILVLIIGNRKGFGKDPNHRPHNVPAGHARCSDPLVRLVRLQRRCSSNRAAGGPHLDQHACRSGSGHARLA